MDAGAFDVLHDPGDQRVGAIAHRVDLDLAAAQVLVHEHAPGAGIERVAEEPFQVVGAVRDLHPTPAEDERGSHQYRISDLACDHERLAERVGGAAGRLGDAERGREFVEAPAVLGEADGVRARADDPTAERLDPIGEIERGLPAELGEDIDVPALVLDDGRHGLLVERLEVEPGRRIEVGRDRLGVAVHHDRGDALLAEGHGALHAAAIELDALPDPDRAAAEHDGLASRERQRLVLLLVRRVEVRRHRLELGGAGVHHLVHRPDPPLRAEMPHVGWKDADERRDVGVGVAQALRAAQQPRRRRLPLQLLFREADDRAQLPQEPDPDARARVDLRLGRAAPEGREHTPEPVIGGDVREVALDEGCRLQRLRPLRRLIEQALPLHLERAERLQERRLEGAVDRHHLARRLHLRAEPAVGIAELVERPARDLHHDVVERRLERRGRPLRHRVRDLVEALADRDLRRDAGDRVARRLRGERRAAGDARVHLDDVVRDLRVRVRRRSLVRVEGELHVAATLDAERADDPQRRAAQLLVLLVGERLGRGDHDGVSGVHAHRIDVLHVADRDAGVPGVAHDLVLELLPAHERPLDEDLTDRRGADAPGRDGAELVVGRREPTTGAAERVRRPDHERVADAGGEGERVIDRVRDRRLRHRLADLHQKLLEGLAVLGLLDRAQGGPEHPHAVALEHPGLGELHGEVEAGLPAKRREQPIGALALDDPLEHLDGERLDVRHIRDTGVGHDRRGIGVDEDGRDPLLAERAAGLRPGVVELRGLADEDRPRADEQHLHDRRFCGGRTIIGVPRPDGRRAGTHRTPARCRVGPGRPRGGTGRSGSAARCAAGPPPSRR